MACRFAGVFLFTLGMSIAVVFLPHKALAKTPEVSFHPARGWSASTPPASWDQPEDHACSVETVFNNGFTVQFYGSGHDPDTLNIDFVQNVFENGQSYDVTLNVPGIKTLTTSGTSSRANLLNINLTGHRDFYEAARNSAVFDIDVEGNNFRFYLSGFAGPAGKFDQCLKGAPPDVVRKAAMSAEDYNKTTLNESIAFERAEMGQSAPVETDVTETYTWDSSEEMIPLPVTPYAASKTEPQRKRLTEQLAEEIKNDPSLLGYTSEGLPPGTRKQVVSNYKSVVSEPLSSQTAPSAMTPLPSEPEDVQDIKAEPVEIKSVEPETVEIAPRKIPEKARMKIHKEKISGEVDFTNIGIESAPVKKSVSMGKSDSELARKVSELENKISNLEMENLSLNEELGSALKESEDERMSISSDNWNLERATMRYNEAERQIKRLGQQLQRERAQCSVEREELESMLFDPQVTSEQQLARLADLEKKLLEAEEKLQDQRLRYEERIRILENQLNTQ